MLTSQNWIIKSSWWRYIFFYWWSFDANRENEREDCCYALSNRHIFSIPLSVSFFFCYWYFPSFIAPCYCAHSSMQHPLVDLDPNATLFFFWEQWWIFLKVSYRACEHKLSSPSFLLKSIKTHISYFFFFIFWLVHFRCSNEKRLLVCFSRVKGKESFLGLARNKVWVSHKAFFLFCHAKCTLFFRKKNRTWVS